MKYTQILLLLLFLFTAGCGAKTFEPPVSLETTQSEGTTEFGSTVEDENTGAETTEGESTSVEYGAEQEEEAPGAAISPVQAVTDLPIDSIFEITFFDVGEADAALVQCDGKSMLIDGGNAGDSQVIFSGLRSRGLDHVEYMVCTHPHEDHVGGLSAALNSSTFDVVFCSETDYDSDAFASFQRYLKQQGLTITVPRAGDTISLGSASVQIIGPLQQSDKMNNNSICLRIQYGNTFFLFTGDAEREEEIDILDAGFDLNSTVLKIGHHGSNTSTSYPFLRAIMPEYAVISVGENNSGHPSDDTLSRLRDAGATVYRTDLYGEIHCTSDGTAITIETAKNPEESVTSFKDSTTESETTIECDYVLNTNTMKFHYPTCSSVGQIKEKNKSYFTGTREDAIAAGYNPCGRCNP